MSIIERLVWHGGRIKLARAVDDTQHRRHPAEPGDPIHFCEHDGIRVRFTRALATWHAHTPCAFKRWWFSLAISQRRTRTDTRQDTRTAEQESRLAGRDAV